MEVSFSAKEFFHQILAYKAGSFAFLEQLSQPESKAEEHEWMDFKGAKQITSHYSAQILGAAQKSNEEHILEIWSEYLGAFANSGGGLLIWGIDAPKRFPKGLSLVKDVNRLRERLLSTALDVVDPPIQGIAVEAIPQNPESLEGLVVCLIPPSKFAPHRSKKAVREYYIRSQDSNVNCQTAVLRRLFYPLSFPLLEPRMELWLGKNDYNETLHLQGSVHLENKGNSTASDVYVKYAGPCDLSLNVEEWIEGSRNSKEYYAKRPIHPGLELALARNLSMRAPINPLEERKISIQFALYAKDSSPMHWMFETSISALITENVGTKMNIRGVETSRG
ncbi:helix-turn-helix domain-containing protein [Prosthecobacter sp.]|uniref:helix-turn-helix domain-containing protein n=1 Tax=Prosthecobacter sp. TaxID=1965333 RepID=UPI0037835B87